MSIAQDGKITFTIEGGVINPAAGAALVTDTVGEGGATGSVCNLFFFISSTVAGSFRFGTHDGANWVNSLIVTLAANEKFPLAIPGAFKIPNGRIFRISNVAALVGTVTACIARDLVALY
jgi:hypothetical protein